MTGTFLYIYIYITVYTYGNASCKHAMLVNGASVVSCDEMSSCASRSRTSVTDRRLIQTCQPH